MMKSILAIAAVALSFALSPARAETAMSCTQAELTKMDGEAAKMADAIKRTEAMKELTMAKDMMGKNDMAGCAMHMEMAGKMMPKM